MDHVYGALVDRIPGNGSANVTGLQIECVHARKYEAVKQNKISIICNCGI